jgi:DNA-binding transcriptional regulator LsrR (DeoR family)
MKNAVTQLGPREMSRIATIARRYYHHGEKQKTIADALGVSQTDISRCLKLAHEHGIVQVFIDPSLTQNLERDLCTAFPHLQEAVVVPLADLPGQSDDAHFLQELGVAGARYLLREAHHGATIGISCGYSVEAVINGIGQLHGEGAMLPIATQIYPLLILMHPELVKVTPAASVAKLVGTLPDAKGQVFQLPRVETEDDLKFYKGNAQIQQLLRQIEGLDYYVVGIGRIDYEGKMREERHKQQRVTHEFNALIWNVDLIESLQTYGAKGEVCYQPFDEHGNLLMQHADLAPLRQSVLYLPLEVLQQHVRDSRARKKTDTPPKKIIAVAGGERKYEAILAALRAQLFNVLVIDSLTADKIVREGIAPTASGAA